MTDYGPTLIHIFTSTAHVAGLDSDGFATARGDHRSSGWRRAAIWVARDLGIPIKAIAEHVARSEHTVSGIALEMRALTHSQIPSARALEVVEQVGCIHAAMMPFLNPVEGL